MPRRLLYLVGTFFGTGFAPFAPATVASFAFGVLWYLVWTFAGPIPVWLDGALLVLVMIVGIPVAGRLEDLHGEDPPLVVIDEVAGMLTTYLWVAVSPWGFVIGFFWFRFFDILKPLGVRKLEHLGGGGGLGIMADDIGAGLQACLATHGTLLILGSMGVLG